MGLVLHCFALLLLSVYAIDSAGNIKTTVKSQGNSIRTDDSVSKFANLDNNLKKRRYMGGELIPVYGYRRATFADMKNMFLEMLDGNFTTFKRHKKQIWEKFKEIFEALFIN